MRDCRLRQRSHISYRQKNPGNRSQKSTNSFQQYAALFALQDFEEIKIEFKFRKSDF